MKNIQVIDGADNCTFSLFEATEEEFAAIFPANGQDIEFIEDAIERLGEEPAARILDAIWQRPLKKPEALGIHGTLFCEFQQKKASFPASKRERDWGNALNSAQRKLYQK